MKSGMWWKGEKWSHGPCRSEAHRRTPVMNRSSFRQSTEYHHRPPKIACFLVRKRLKVEIDSVKPRRPQGKTAGSPPCPVLRPGHEDSWARGWRAAGSDGRRWPIIWLLILKSGLSGILGLEKNCLFERRPKPAESRLRPSQSGRPSFCLLTTEY